MHEAYTWCMITYQVPGVFCPARKSVVRCAYNPPKKYISVVTSPKLKKSRGSQSRLSPSLPTTVRASISIARRFSYFFLQLGSNCASNYTLPTFSAVGWCLSRNKTPYMELPKTTKTSESGESKWIVFDVNHYLVGDRITLKISHQIVRVCQTTKPPRNYISIYISIYYICYTPPWRPRPKSTIHVLKSLD